MATNPPLILDAYWPYHVAVLGDLVARHTAQIAREHGDLNLSQWRVLAAVGELPGRTARDVVDLTPMDKGIVSRAVSALIERGLMERQAKENDRRQGSLSLSLAGAQVYARIAAELTAAIKPVTHALEDESAFVQALKAASEAYKELKG
ncbi:MAG: MarR family winged helix-turn-helix transcriptional regulator [Pseudomonadota bacterium]